MKGGYNNDQTFSNDEFSKYETDTTHEQQDSLHLAAELYSALNLTHDFSSNIDTNADPVSNEIDSENRSQSTQEIGDPHTLSEPMAYTAPADDHSPYSEATPAIRFFPPPPASFVLEAELCLTCPATSEMQSDRDFITPPSHVDVQPPGFDIHPLNLEGLLADSASPTFGQGDLLDFFNDQAVPDGDTDVGFRPYEMATVPGHQPTLVDTSDSQLFGMNHSSSSLHTLDFDCNIEGNDQGNMTGAAADDPDQRALTSWGETDTWDTYGLRFNQADTTQYSDQYSNDGSCYTFSGVPTAATSEHLGVPPIKRRRKSDPPPVLTNMFGNRSTNASPSSIKSFDPNAFQAMISSQDNGLGSSPDTDARTPLESGAASPYPRRRAKRHGPLPDHMRATTAKTRSNKTVCIACKSRRVKCVYEKNSKVCTRCRKSCSKVNFKGPHACALAEFCHLVTKSSTNPIAFRDIKHVCWDGKQRRLLSIPYNFTIEEFSSTILDLSRDYTYLRVTDHTNYYYDISLDLAYEGLKSITTSVPCLPFRDFINNAPQLVINKSWENCIKDSTSKNGIMDSLVRWSNMPSLATYSLIADSNEPARTLDPDSVIDVGLIQAAAQLACILGRNLEHVGYKYLQDTLTQSERMPPSFLLNLGRLLLSLRWRLCWWNLAGNRMPRDDDTEREEEEDTETVKILCWVLYVNYCYYCRIASTSANYWAVSGEQSWYVDTTWTIYEEFPTMESQEGFEEWMRTGEGKILEAGLVDSLSIFGFA